VINEQVAICLANFVTSGNIIKDRIASLGSACLIEDVERFNGFEFVLFVHIVLRHDLFKFCARHVHTTPSIGRKRTNIMSIDSTIDE
jgi:hypothetical protein